MDKIDKMDSIAKIRRDVAFLYGYAVAQSVDQYQHNVIENRHDRILKHLRMLWDDIGSMAPGWE